ncbi:M14 family zinc carboxypeptidase, partial [Elusimicrobiota bacterium]
MKRSLSVCIVASLGLALAVSARAADPLFDGTEEPSQRPTVKKLVEESAVSVPGTGEVAGMDNRMWVEIRAANSSARSRLAEMGMSIEELGDGTVSGVVDPEGLALIEADGFVVVRRVFLRNFHSEDFPSEDSIYHNYDELASELSSLNSAAPDIATVFSIGTSHEGRDLMAIRLTSGYGDKPGI